KRSHHVTTRLVGGETVVPRAFALRAAEPLQRSAPAISRPCRQKTIGVVTDPHFRFRERQRKSTEPQHHRLTRLVAMQLQQPACAPKYKRLHRGVYLAGLEAEVADKAEMVVGQLDRNRRVAAEHASVIERLEQRAVRRPGGRLGERITKARAGAVGE